MPLGGDQPYHNCYTQHFSNAEAEVAVLRATQLLSETIASPSRILTRHLNTALSEEAGLPVEGTRKIWAQVPLHSLCIHMLVTFNGLM